MLKGRVVHGAGRGHGLGYPTINVDMDGALNEHDLEHGVYAVWVSLEKSVQKFKGAMNWGPQPTFNESLPQVEIFLLDFEGDLYGQVVEVEPKKRIRGVQCFESKVDLMAQIKVDVGQVRSLNF
jgi:riboflavin kinase/FMN adenylyltransferase